MKLKIIEFEKFSQSQNIKAKRFLKILGGGKFTYRHLKKGRAIGYELARKIYNGLGECKFLTLIDFEEETLDGFKAKYITIGKKLY